LIPGLISDAGRLAADVARQRGWFNVATLQEPYRVEGKKTMGLELAEQLGWRLPDAIIYPAGGGTGIVGMWKAFAELHELGWLQDGKDRHLPKMIIVQAEGCAPLVRAFERGDEEAEFWQSEEANTLAAGLRVPAAIGDRLILKAIYESGGTAIRVSDEAMMQMVQYAAQREGMLIAFEAAATLAAYHTLLARHFLEPGDETVLFFTGSGLPCLPEIGKYSF
jgi:threonine synthase